jgi:hypothetical protein
LSDLSAKELIREQDIIWRKAADFQFFWYSGLFLLCNFAALNGYQRRNLKMFINISGSHLFFCAGTERVSVYFIWDNEEVTTVLILK